MKFRFSLKMCAVAAFLAATYFAAIRDRIRLRREAISCQPMLKDQLSNSFTGGDIFLVDEFGQCQVDSIRFAEPDGDCHSLLKVARVEEVEINDRSMLAKDIETSPAVRSCEYLLIGPEVQLTREWVRVIGQLENLRTLVIRNNRFRDQWIEELSGLERAELILLKSNSITGQFLGAMQAPNLKRLILSSPSLRNSSVAEGVGILMQNRNQKVELILTGGGLTDEIFKRLGTREKLYFIGMPDITVEGVMEAQKTGLDVDRSRPVHPE